MKVILANCLLVFLAVCWLVARHGEIRKLRQQKQTLDQQLKSFRQSATGKASLPNRLIDANELFQLRSERSELMRLRSEMGRLRQSASLSAAELEKQTQAALERATEAQRQADLLTANIEAERRSKFMLETGNNLMIDAQEYAKQMGGQYPGSPSDIENRMRQNPRLAHLFQNPQFKINFVSSTEAQQLGIRVDDFEFIPATLPAGSSDRAIVLRERKARQLPDGTWARVYGIARAGAYRAAVQELHSANGDFTDLEIQALGKPQKP